MSDNGHYSSVDDVLNWNVTAGNVCPKSPTIISERDFRLKMDLILEEIDEWEEGQQANSKLEIFDALCDIQVILDGMFAAYGMAEIKEAGIKEVMRANWSKFDSEGNPIKRADGKVLKGPHYVPPNLEPIVDGTEMECN